jgi:hypothetical protein
MKPFANQTRRAFCLSAVSAAATAGGVRLAAATTEDAGGLVSDMAAALQTAPVLSFTAEMTFGESVSKAGLKSLGSQATVTFNRGGGLLAVYGPGGPDVHVLVSGVEAVVFRPSLAAKTVIAAGEDPAAAFMFPGLFLPFMGLTGADVKAAMFGKIDMVTAIAQGQPDQAETTRLAAVMAERFTGEIWVDKASKLPARIIGTYLPAKAGPSASAATVYTGWKTDSLPAADFGDKGLAAFKTVPLADLGL